MVAFSPSEGARGEGRAEARCTVLPVPIGRPGDEAERPTPAGVVRVATYVRISTDEAHQPYSLDAQRERLAAYIRSQPCWVAGPEYCDEFSGARTDRPDLQQALTAAQAGGFDILLVYRVDRLARSLTVLTAVLDSLTVAGVGLRSVTEPIDTSSSVGRLLLQMLGVFAQFEREVIIDRVICGMERKAAVGGWTGGTLPYGYLVDARAERLLPHTDEAPVVASIFAAYAGAACGTRTIATQLNARGLRTRSGRPWTGQAVGRLLSNRTYLGERTFRDVTVTGTHPPLVSQQTFDQVQHILALRMRHQPGPAASTSDYLLSGVVVCATCGAHYVGTAANGRHHRYRYYTCQARSRGRASGCTGPRLRADTLEDLILTAIADRYQDSRLVTEAIRLAPVAHATTTNDHRIELATLRRQITSVSHKIGRHQRAFEDDTLPAELYADRTMELRQQADQLKARRRELRRALQQRRSPPDSTSLEPWRRQFHSLLATTDTTRLKNLVGILVAEVRVHDRHRIEPFFLAIA